ncbi:DNA cytosine methyltransferase [Roseateles sp. DC23W]|uniref:DNA (cytosine-5-)-methyltransferase n=1 Tax=Pelomonas dachongensis TaxID=3299029 RepID=A0ABW7EK33_9BURK
MLKPQFILNLAAKLVVVLFAGAGGSCTGIEQALGRHVDIAANHSETAVSCHRANHPQTRHYREDVRKLMPREITGNQPVGYLHLSPDCTHFSQAKGGQPRDTAIRSLPWVGIRWAGTVKPDVITLENVREVTKWGRLIAKRDKATGRVVKLDGTVAAVGERVPVQQQFLVPDPKDIGRTWARYLQAYRNLGYVVEWRVLNAADYGVPQRRRRLFLVARRDGMPIVWPEPTHVERPSRGQKRVVPSHTCIDFSIPSRSIFGRDKDLAPATLRRVARGLKLYVLDNPEPFIVNNMTNNVPRPVSEPMATVVAGGGHKVLVTPVTVPLTHSGRDRVHNISTPLPTVTTSKGGEVMLAAPTLIQAGYGERPGQAPRALDIDAPLGTVVAGGGKHALVTAFVEQANGGFYEGCGRGVDEPLSTVTTSGSQQRLVAASLAQLRNNCSARDLRDPLQTVSAGGEHHALVEYTLSAEAEEGALRCAAFLMQYYSEGGQWSDLRHPANTVTTRDRLALVTVWIKGDPFVIVDITLRMLTPRELANATSFPPDYILDRGHDGRKFSKAQQVHMIGNAVPPLLQQVVTAANYRDEPWPEMREAA